MAPDDRERDRDGLFEDLDSLLSPGGGEPPGAASTGAPSAPPPADVPFLDEVALGDEGDDDDDDEFALVDEGYPVYPTGDDEDDELLGDEREGIDIRADAPAGGGAGPGEGAIADIFADDGPDLFSFADGPATGSPAGASETGASAPWDLPRASAGVGGGDDEDEVEDDGDVVIPASPTTGGRPSYRPADPEIKVRGAFDYDDGDDPGRSPYVDLPSPPEREQDRDEESRTLDDLFARALRPTEGADVSVLRDRGDDRASDGASEDEYAALSRLLGEVDDDDAEGLFGPAAAREDLPTGEGPRWQDPTSVEAGHEPERRPGRSLPLAFATGAGLLIAAVGTLVAGAPWFALFGGAMVLIAQGEFYAAVRGTGARPATALGLVSGALVLSAGYLRGEAAMLGMVGFSTVAAYAWYLVQPADRRRDVVINVSVTMYGVIAIPLLAGFLLTALSLPGGEEVVIAAIGLTIAYDTAAFFTGYLWGRRPMAPSVSPRKSWEGAIGATVVVVGLSAGVVAATVPALNTVGRAIGLGLVISVLAPLGDLAESLLKRDLGIKDMGSILPGHGGVLDRIDALLLVAPGALLYLRVISG